MFFLLLLEVPRGNVEVLLFLGVYLFVRVLCEFWVFTGCRRQALTVRAGSFAGR